jgi:hypothetical protein
MKIIDFSLPPVAHIWVTLSDIKKIHFTIKEDPKDGF